MSTSVYSSSCAKWRCMKVSSISLPQDNDFPNLLVVQDDTTFTTTTPAPRQVLLFKYIYCSSLTHQQLSLESNITVAQIASVFSSSRWHDPYDYHPRPSPRSPLQLSAVLDAPAAAHRVLPEHNVPRGAADSEGLLQGVLPQPVLQGREHHQLRAVLREDGTVALCQGGKRWIKFVGVDIALVQTER
jgi:hypothetical protein